MTTDEKKEQRGRVRDWLYHLLVFVLIAGLMAILDVRAGTGSGAVLGLDWAFWVILFWGFAVGAHGVWAWFGED